MQEYEYLKFGGEIILQSGADLTTRKAFSLITTRIIIYLKESVIAITDFLEIFKAFVRK